MLSVTTYEPAFIDAARSRVDEALAAYRAAVASAPAEAVAALEPSFFNDQVLLLDYRFVHRARGQEGKDGNPMNEVRVIANSLVTNGGVLLADKQIKLKPETSVLGLAVGDEIRLTEDQFVRLCDAYFASIRTVFS